MASPQPSSLVVISCPHCGTRYQVAYESIGKKGRSVLCAHCGQSWDARADPPPRLAMPEPRPAPPPSPAKAPPAPPPPRVVEVSDKDFGSLAEEMLDEKFVIEEQRHKARHEAALRAEEEARTAKAKPKSKTTVEEAAIARAAERAAAIANADASADGDSFGDEHEKTVAELRAAADQPDVKFSSASHRKVQQEFSKRQRSAYSKLPVARFRRWARIAALGALVALFAGGILLRAPLVQQFPQLAGAYAAVGLPVNVVGLEFRDVRTLQSLQDGAEVLVVEGTIASVSSHEAPMPPVIVTLVGNDGSTVYQWSMTPQATELEPGETVHFQTQLSKPPHNAAQVKLGFANGRVQTRAPDAGTTPAGAASGLSTDASSASTDDAPQIKIVIPGNPSASPPDNGDAGGIQIIDNGATTNGQNPSR